MDRSNTNAQNSNARALLSRFSDRRAHWTAVTGDDEAGLDGGGDVVQTHRISSSRLWQCHLAIAYHARFDAIFYPGPHWGDQVGLNARRLTRRQVPVIATIEGIITGPDSLQQLSKLFGHPVFSQPGTDAAVPRIRWMYETCDHIVAISPFLASVAQALYGEKVSCLALGVEKSIFHDRGRREPARPRIVGCGTVKASKNPQMFLRLAATYRQAELVWFGDGIMRPSLIVEANRMGLENLRFPGALTAEILAEEFRHSSFFVLPSRAEGVPKVTQEAAACGLPIVVHGFYEPPTVVHKTNGLVSWSDDELIEQVGVLIDSPESRLLMSQHGAAMAKAWDWDLIACKWEDLLIRLISSQSPAG